MIKFYYKSMSSYEDIISTLDNNSVVLCKEISREEFFHFTNIGRSLGCLYLYISVEIENKIYKYHYNHFCGKNYIFDISESDGLVRNKFEFLPAELQNFIIFNIEYFNF